MVELVRRDNFVFDSLGVQGNSLIFSLAVVQVQILHNKLILLIPPDLQFTLIF